MNGQIVLRESRPQMPAWNNRMLEAETRPEVMEVAQWRANNPPRVRLSRCDHADGDGQSGLFSDPR